MSKELYCVNDALEEFKQVLVEYTESNNSLNYSLQDFVDKLNGNQKCLDTLYTHVLKYYYLYVDQKNEPWRSMKLQDWISSPNHPCPIITIASNPINHRINNYTKINVKKYPLFKFDIDFRTKGKCIDSKRFDGYMKFQKNIDKYILHEENELDPSDWYQINIHAIMSKAKQNKSYLLIFGPPTLAYRIRLLFTKMARVKIAAGKSEIVGNKIKFHLIEKQIDWDNYDIKKRLWFHQLSRHLSELAFKYKYIVGNCFYYYRYVSKYYRINNIKYCHITYDPNKPLKSIQQYYSTFDKSQILQQQNAALPPNFKLTSIDKIGSIDKAHAFYIGLSLTDNVITLYWKNKIFRNVYEWVTGSVPSGIHADPTNNRWKFFLYYWYVYPKKGVSTAEYNRQCKIAGGLRKIDNHFIPDWIHELITFLKNKNFIKSDLEINQIGINYYFNQNEDKSGYSCISPHFEHNKFKYVYSVSIYSDPQKQSFISFNLMKGTHNGDIKIPLRDRGGCTMLNPSWCMNIVHHCVPKYELPLGIGQWRIVILFRSILDIHVKYFNNNKKAIASSSSSSSSTKNPRKRKFSEI